MSRKPAKKQPSIAERKPTMEDLKLLEAQLKNSETQMEQRVEYGIEHIKNLLETTSKKLLTVNGVMTCFQSLRDIQGKHASFYADDLITASDIAIDLSDDMLEWIKQVPSAEEAIADPGILDEMLGKFYTHNFAQGYIDIIKCLDEPETEVVLEIQRMSICQQIGPVAEEIAQFIDNQQAEIKNTVEQIAAIRDQMGIEESETAKIIELPAKE